jgi:hypothetical protein
MPIVATVAIDLLDMVGAPFDTVRITRWSVRTTAGPFYHENST